MESIFGLRVSKPNPSPLEGFAGDRAQQGESSLRQIGRREWWLWLSASVVTMLAGLAFLLSSFRSFFLFLRSDHFYEIRSDQARWGIMCLLLLFNTWMVYRLWSFRRLSYRIGHASLPVAWERNSPRAAAEHFAERRQISSGRLRKTQCPLRQGRNGRGVERVRQASERSQPGLRLCCAVGKRRFLAGAAQMYLRRNQAGIGPAGFY